MRIVSNLLLLAVGTLLWGCDQGPEIKKGKGNIHGKVIAQPHKDFIEKVSSLPDDQLNEYQLGDDKRILFTAEMVNYDKLKEIYVGLIHPVRQSQVKHNLIISDNKISRRSVMVAKGDVLIIRNNGSKPLNLYILNPSTDDIEEYPAIIPGKVGELVVNMVGALQLGADEDDKLTIDVLSAINLVGQQVQSGNDYAFTGLKPGTYKVIFWYWRLGLLEHKVDVRSGTNHRLDETLAVDRIVR